MEEENTQSGEVICKSCEYVIISNYFHCKECNSNLCVSCFEEKGHKHKTEFVKNKIKMKGIQTKLSFQ